MGGYSLIERRMAIPYDTIEGQYFSDGGFILSVPFLVPNYLK